MASDVLDTRSLLREAYIAHKKLMEYIVKYRLKSKDLREDHPTLGDELRPLLRVIKAARQAAYVKRYQKSYDRVKIHPLKIKEGKSHRKILKQKRDAKAKLLKKTFTYPATIEFPDFEAKRNYRIIFLKHSNSGMPVELAEKYAIRDYKKYLKLYCKNK